MLAELATPETYDVVVKNDRSSTSSSSGPDSSIHSKQAGGVRWLDLPLVYLAGPYSSPDPVKNVDRVIDLADQLLSEGIVVPYVPHLTHLWHQRRPRRLEEWYSYDLVILARCDAVLRLSGESEGADREVRFAKEHGLPIFESVSELVDWGRRRSDHAVATAAEAISSEGGFNL